MPLWRTARDLIDANFPSSFRASHADRERNAEADALANTAITVGSQVGAGANVAPRGGPGRTGEAAARETGGGGGGGGGGTGGAAAAASRRMRGAEASRPRAFRAIRRGGEDIGRPIALGVVRAMSSSATGTKRPAPFDARDRARTRESRENRPRSRPSRRRVRHRHTRVRRRHARTRHHTRDRSVGSNLRRVHRRRRSRPSPWRARSGYGRRLSRRRARHRSVRGVERAPGRRRARSRG